MAMRNKRVFAAAVLTLLLTLTVGMQFLSSALANPIPVPLIRVYSPQNNKIYSSNDVQLNFTEAVFPNTGISVSSFGYSLDGKPIESTNGSTILAGLSSGSHTLTIYGTVTYSLGNEVHENNSTLAIVYFSTSYSTAWIVFSISMAVAIFFGSLILLFKRRQFVSALKGRKTFSFWLGLVCFLFFAILVFAPATWQAANDYLFPYYPHGMTVMLFPDGGITFGLIFMVIGWFLMRRGTRKNQTVEIGEH
jgi:hypothetical protein